MYTQLSTFLNIHTGQKAFVCGSGTSLNLCPINLAEYGIVVCVNASGLHFTNYQYLFVTDEAVLQMEYWPEVSRKADNIILANYLLHGFFDEVKSTLAPHQNLYLLTRNYEDHHNYRFDNFNKLCLGLDAAAPATHFAYTLGCRPIVLCGIDLCFNANGERYFNKNAFNHQVNSKYAEAYAIGFEKAKIHTKDGPSDTFLQGSLPIWHKIWQQNHRINEVIYNASPISAIAHFTKVDIKDMLT